MGTLVRYADTRGQCWSRVNLASGEPIWISVAESSIVVKRSRLGIMGAKLYLESNVDKAARTAQTLDAEVAEYNTPTEMTNPVLRVFTQAALEAESAAELSIRLNRASRSVSDSLANMTDQDAQHLVYAFADVLAEHCELILDADLLPADKNHLYQAFFQLIRHYEDLRSINPGTFKESGYEDTLQSIRSLHLRVSDFQYIDPEDRDAVVRINAGPSVKELSESVAKGDIPPGERDAMQHYVGEAMRLYLKYHQRAMAEVGLKT